MLATAGRIRIVPYLCHHFQLAVTGAEARSLENRDTEGACIARTAKYTIVESKPGMGSRHSYSGMPDAIPVHSLYWIVAMDCAPLPKEGS
jgi:hypothetical protein